LLAGQGEQAKVDAVFEERQKSLQKSIDGIKAEQAKLSKEKAKQEKD